MATKERRRIKSYQQKRYPFEQLETRLDPELRQAAMLRDRSEPQKPGTWFKAANNETWLDVLVKLRNRHEIPGMLAPGSMIENPDPRSLEAIVTGAVREVDIEALREHHNVISLKLSRKVIPVQESVSAPRPATLHSAIPGPPDPLDGSGVLVGVVDFGCDFAHPNFRNEQGGSRLLSLWDQRGSRSAPPGRQFPYGQELTKQTLDWALQPAANDPYDIVGYRLSASSHGTPVLDIAAGNGRGTGLPGMAPGAHLVFVDLGEPLRDEDPLNDRRLLDAVAYIFQKADEASLPAVVNLSLGLFAGSHDGRSLLEQGLDWLLSKPQRAIVVAAGNAGNKPVHAAGKVPAQGSFEIEWKVVPNGHQNDECEIWYPGSRELVATLIPPPGVNAVAKPVALRQAFELLSNGQLVGDIIHEKEDPNNGDNQIKLRVPPIDQPDHITDQLKYVWKIRLDNPGPTDVEFHAWIERDDQGQSHFLKADPSYTLGSLACGMRTLVVGGHGVHGARATAFTGVGPTRDGRLKPEVCAPAVNVLAAKARSYATRTPLRGTSAAAPHVAGLVARLYQTGSSLKVDRARELVTGREASLPWDPKIGFGRIDAALLSTLRPTPVSAEAQPPAVPEASMEESVSRSAKNTNESWQARLMEQVLAGAAAGKIRLTIEVDPQNVP